MFAEGEGEVAVFFDGVVEGSAIALVCVRVRQHMMIKVQVTQWTSVNSINDKKYCMDKNQIRSDTIKSACFTHPTVLTMMCTGSLCL